MACDIYSNISKKESKTESHLLTSSMFPLNKFVGFTLSIQLERIHKIDGFFYHINKYFCFVCVFVENL